MPRPLARTQDDLPDIQLSPSTAPAGLLSESAAHRGNSKTPYQSRQVVASPWKSQYVGRWPAHQIVLAKNPEMWLLRDQNDRWAYAVLRSSPARNGPVRNNLAFRREWGFELFRLGGLQLCESVPHARRRGNIGWRCLDACFRRSDRLGRDGRQAGVELDALRPLSIGMNPDHRQDPSRDLPRYSRSRRPAISEYMRRQ